MIKTSEGLVFPDEHIIYTLPKLLDCAPEDIFFIDIETTGLSPKSSDIYLIGVAYYDKHNWHICQFFAENSSQEEEVLKAFSSFVKSFKIAIHFNGDRFDIPFIQNKLEKYGLEDPFASMSSLDIYKEIKDYKRQLGLLDCKQKTIELYLGIQREDKYDGGKLIPIYKQYTKSKDSELLKLLMLHNFEDVKGMFELLPMLRYRAFFLSFSNMPDMSIRTDAEIPTSEEVLDLLPLRARKVQANYYDDIDGQQKTEVYMKLSLRYKLPSSLSGNLDGCYFKIEGDEAILRVPLYETELKYFYSNYKDYYYLPQEDTAIHKSIASFVDKDFREKATAENCYTKKKGQYLREWDLCFSPFFKKNYSDKEFFFDLNDNMKQSRFAMSLYACHVIAHVLEL
ncbi:hypothetical protein SAMN02910275_00368 [Butyrivibrio sp. INlla18]|uniref:ribonuclease H-like domain-containing protein n=1 Tax=Butyrivibrio sp. INlla18 TaxID=1520806 RepID=UPI00088BD444|nr:ribonuclease H-like domain-containing protein [Butyrivibrio sp. INlla18]SDA42556.1 hypothetical protein SAMN02910275_00368 [Butyrivibrio sp. INlla18]